MVFVWAPVYGWTICQNGSPRDVRSRCRLSWNKVKICQIGSLFLVGWSLVPVGLLRSLSCDLGHEMWERGHCLFPPYQTPTRLRKLGHGCTCAYVQILTRRSPLSFLYRLAWCYPCRIFREQICLVFASVVAIVRSENPVMRESCLFETSIDQRLMMFNHCPREIFDSSKNDPALIDRRLLQVLNGHSQIRPSTTFLSRKKKKLQEAAVNKFFASWLRGWCDGIVRGLVPKKPQKPKYRRLQGDWSLKKPKQYGGLKWESFISRRYAMFFPASWGFSGIRQGFSTDTWPTNYRHAANSRPTVGR